MPRIQRTILVLAPVDRVYQWWARWEGFAEVFPRIREVRRSGAHTLHWRAEDAAGDLVEWEAAIVHDLPQVRLEWESRGAVKERGALSFEAVSRNQTRIQIVILEGDEGPLAEGETAFLAHDLDAALSRFKEAVESEPLEPPLAHGRPYRDVFYRAMSAAAGVLLILALGFCAVALVEVWMIMLGAMLLGATLRPAVEWQTEQLKLPRALAVSTTFGAVLAVIAVLFIVLIPMIMTQGQDLAVRLPALVADLQALLTRLHAEHPFVPEGTQLMPFLANQGSQVVGNAFSLTTRFLWLLVVVLSILFLALFLLLDGWRLQRTLLRLIPIPQKSHLPALLHTVEERVGRYMLGLALICILAGLLTWGALAFMGVPYALLIGGVTALLQAIPFVGPLIGGALAALLALSRSPETALWTVLVYTIIQQIIGQFLFPVLMGRTLGMHPVWIALALLIGGTLYGLVGAFIAIPVAIALSIVIECYYLPWAEAQAATAPEPPEEAYPR